MQKKINTVYMANLLICLSIVCSLPITSCKDDNEEGYEIVYPSEEDNKPYIVTNKIGNLSFNEIEDKWVIYPENYGDETVIYMIINNMKEEYKEYKGNIKYSGTVTTLYYKIYSWGRRKTIIKTINLTSIEPTSTDARSINDLTDKEICKTPSPEPPIWYFSRSASNELNYKNNYRFRVYTHIIRSSEGNGIDKENISNIIIANLNNQYSESNISFFLSGSEYIDSDYYNLISDDDVEEVFSLNCHSNAIDIYIFSNGINLGNLAGLAENIPATACLVRNGSYANSSTLAHEISHCLGLYHTHHGTAKGDYYEGGTPELVNGSNSNEAGDYITDTAADPCKWQWMDNYTGVGTDANGDIYRPDPWNIMSYSGYSQNILTQKQIERIHQTIENTPKLKATCIATTKQITGPDYIKEEATYSVDVPDGSIVLWNITCKTYTDKTSAPSITTETLTGSSITLVNKNPQSTSQRYEMDVTITTPKGYVMHATKTVYHVLFSGKTGYLRWGYTGTPNNGDTISILYPSKNKTIEVTQGGSLAFYYADESGASSRSESSYYYFEMSNTTAFNRVPATNHAFYCKTDALPITISNVLLMIRINGFSNVIQIPIKIKEKTTYTMEEDSIETDITMNLNNKQLIKY